MITLKILSYKSPQRYAVRQTLKAAQKEVCNIFPTLVIAIVDVKELTEIEKYTPVVILPSLVVNEKLVCVGRFPKKHEVLVWLMQAVNEHAS